MFGRSRNDGSPLEQALDAAAGLKPGSWTSVEALSMLAIETGDRPEADRLYQAALDVSSGLKPGSWDSVRALAWLARAGREVRPG